MAAADARTSEYCTAPNADMSSDSRDAVIVSGSPSMCSARSSATDLLLLVVKQRGRNSMGGC